VKEYEVQEAIQLPKGIKNETKLRYEKKVKLFFDKGTLQ
jgi:hypothetical protein